MNSKVLSGVFFILTLSVTGCITEYNTMLSPNDTKILFVDGSIIENTDVTFSICQSFPLNVDVVPEESFINNAVVNIIGSNGYKSSSATNQGRGTYLISVGELDDDVAYGVQIEYSGDTYQSALSKPVYTPEIDSVSWSQPDSTGMVSFHVSTHNNRGESEFYIWNYTEDWEIKSAYATAIFYNPEENNFYADFSTPYYYCWRKDESNRLLVASTESLKENRIVNRQLYGHDSEDSRFSILYSVNVKQKAISKGAYEYYQNIVLLNEEMGGLFTPQPSELTGNITCITDPSKKVMGYVETAKNISQKRIFVYREQLTRPNVHPDCAPLEKGNLPGPEEYAKMYNRGFRPAMIDYDYNISVTLLPSEWALSHCTDCTNNGGTKNKPDFWPNDHQ